MGKVVEFSFGDREGEEIAEIVEPIVLSEILKDQVAYLIMHDHLKHDHHMSAPQTYQPHKHELNN